MDLESRRPNLFRFTVTDLRELHIALMTAFEETAVLVPALNFDQVRSALAAVGTAGGGRLTRRPDSARDPMTDEEPIRDSPRPGPADERARSITADRLGRTELAPLVHELARRYENGTAPTTLTLRDLSFVERRAADLLGLDRLPPPTTRLAVARLATAVGIDGPEELRAVVEQLVGPLAWVECHVAAFEFFGGAPERVVPDNLKTGVVKPDLYDPIVNKAFGELAAHYQVLVDPARILKPRDKARVERPVPYVRDSFFAGRADDFPTLVVMQRDALRWCRQVANLRAHRGIERVAPQALFDAEEKACLLALPRTPFELCRWSSPKVGPDIHIKVGQGPLQRPVAADRQDGRHEGARPIGRDLLRGVARRHPRARRTGQADQLRPLPAREDRLHDAHPGVVPPPGRRARSVDRRRGVGPHGGERPVSPAQGPGGGRSGRQARRGAPRRRVRQGRSPPGTPPTRP